MTARTKALFFCFSLFAAAFPATAKATVGLEIGEVDFANELGLVDVKGLVDVISLGQPAGPLEQVRPHGPIGQDRSPG